MAVTQVADIIEPSVYLQYMQYERPEQNAFVRSGIVAAPPDDIASQMNAGGWTIDMPEWDDLGREEPDIINDDPSDEAVPSKIGTRQTQAIKHGLHKSWSNMDLSGMKATGNRNDPVSVVLQRMGAYWTYQEQQKVISSVKGVFADNAANDSSDMSFSVYSDVAAGSLTSANRLSPAAVNSARLTMGDMLNELVAVAIHSDVYGTMLNGDNTDFERDSQAPFGIGRYMGLDVIVDDTLPVTAGTNTSKYACYLFGRGAFAYMDAAVDAEWAFERYRAPAAGNGGGQTTVHTRRKMLLHPRGFSFTKASMASYSPTNTELATAGNWDRKYDRKKIRLAALYVNV